MSRYAGYLFVLLVPAFVGGCSSSKSDPSPPPAQDLPTPARAAPDREASPAERVAPAVADAPGENRAPEEDATEKEPTVLGAVGRAVTNALGISDDKPSEAPTYRRPR